MTDKPKREFRCVHPKRLEIASGDICLSYSLDEIVASASGARPDPFITYGEHTEAGQATRNDLTVTITARR